jgi:hypothetical protein
VTEIRTARSHGVREKLNSGERTALIQIRSMPGYEVLLDLMEMSCIEQESKLINTPVDRPDSVLAEHRMSKAFWQVFQAVQKKVEFEIALQLGMEADRKAAMDEGDEDPDQILLRP